MSISSDFLYLQLQISLLFASIYCVYK